MASERPANGEPEELELAEGEARPRVDVPPRPVPLWIKHSGLGFGLTLVLGLLTLLIYQLLTWPDVESLRHREPRTTAFIARYQEFGRASGAPKVSWVWVPYDSISIATRVAVVAAEDMGFFWHDGFAYAEMRVAVGEALSGKRGLRGASTITQQVAKNLWLSPSRNPWRKLKEALLTRQLEKHLSKRRILAIYLNVAEFGPGIYGIEAAARSYFGKSAAELDGLEAAQLAAALPRPRRWHPHSTSDSYRRYVAEIEARMERFESLWRQVTP